MSAVIFKNGITGKMIDACVKSLSRGGLIIYPTDTLYGIGCDLKNGKALEKLNKLKKRARSKSFSFICDTLSEASKYAKISNTAYRVMKKTLPGPYTFLLPMNRQFPRKMANADHAVGIRVPDHQIPLEIVRQFGSPIITTSVNVASEEPLNSIGDLSAEFLNAVDVIIDDGPLENEPSTIVDFTGSVPGVVRAGKGMEELKPYIDFVIE